MALRMLLLAQCTCTSGQTQRELAVEPDGYDCLMRRLALSYTADVVLGPRGDWSPGSAHRAHALSLVAHGLRIGQCNATAATAGDRDAQGTATPSGRDHGTGEAHAGPRPCTGTGGQLLSTTLFVATTGDDTAAGTAEAPLKSISGAQAKIRALYPTVSSRPAMRVLIQPGDYFFGAAGPDHLRRATRYSGSSMARFGALDSGASPAKPITYAAAQPDAATPASFIGGLPLTGLSWVPAGGGYPATAFKAFVPGTVLFDVQDQLFLDRLPLVRARIPNGKPWIPLDGFNLSTIGLPGELSGPPHFTQCTGHRRAGAGTGAGVAGGSGTPGGPASDADGNLSEPADSRSGNDDVIVRGKNNCSSISHACLHNAKPILTTFTSVDPAACCANCTANPKCVSWNINTRMKQCFLRGSFKPNAGAGCVSGCIRGACSSPPPPPPRPPPPPTAGTCVNAAVICNSTNANQVSGTIGTTSASGRSLVGGKSPQVRVSHCLQRQLGLANDFPVWAAQSFGLESPCNYSNPSSNCANAMCTAYNFPRWFGPWARGIKFDPSQDTGTKAASSFEWGDAAHVVVHAMAVGEWGGVQYQVASAAPSGGGGKTDLVFSHGGYQQARGAAFRHGSSRYYMEGSREFLDHPGEWFFEPISRELLAGMQTPIYGRG